MLQQPIATAHPHPHHHLQQQQQMSQHHQLMHSHSGGDAHQSAASQQNLAPSGNQMGATGGGAQQMMMNGGGGGGAGEAGNEGDAVSPSAPGAEQVAPLCIRTGCTNNAVPSSDWEDEYCSNECVITHCRDVFGNWVQNSNGQQPNVYPSVVK